MKYYLFILLFIFSITQAKAVIMTVGAVDDIDCDFNDLQTAINSVVDETEIRVSNTIVVTGNTSIQNKPVNILHGGYSSCAADAEITDNTEMVNDGSTALYLYFSNEIIDSLEVSNFDIHASNTGISIDDDFADGQYQMVININNINIFENNTGLYFQANQSTLNIDYSSIYSNGTLDANGGGLQCNYGGGIINILEHTAIYDNQAYNGAGIYLVQCQLNLFAGGYNADGSYKYGVFNNSAVWSGGGISMTSSTVNASGDVNHPVIISANSTIQGDSDHGGAAVSISKDSSINLINAIVDNNTTVRYGAAFYARYYENMGGSPPVITMSRHADGCNYAEYCSSISHNTTTSAFAGSAFDGFGDINISQTIIESNKADKALFNIKYNSVNSDIQLEGNLIIANTAVNEAENSQYLFYSRGEINSIRINFTTIADNLASDLFALSYSGSHPQTLRIYNSIIYNSASQIVNSWGSIDDHYASIECSILHDLSTEGIEDLNTQVIDPLFANGYKLAINSPAIDANCSNINQPNSNDIIGNSRLADSAADLGAYEYEYIDTIFASSFE